jgi:drug/metabolite transporter (DMT)-like permease
MSPAPSDGQILFGQAACLLAASLWAVSVTIFRDPIRTYGAQAVNLFKCTTATLLQGLTVLALGLGPAFAATPARDLVFVAASGVVGLTLGDTALFAAVSRIGGHRTLLLQTLAPVFTALLAAVFQDERLAPAQALGGACVLSGVALVVAPRRARPAGGTPISPGGPVSRAAGATAVGIGFAVVAAFGQGSGVVLAKAGMDTLPVLPASFLRLAAAAAGLVLLSVPTGRLARAVRLARHAPDAARAGTATFLGTYLALFLMMAGVAFAPASIAAVLLSTSPVFSLIVERVADRRPISARSAVGTAIAVAGVAVLVAG